MIGWSEAVKPIPERKLQTLLFVSKAKVGYQIVMFFLWLQSADLAVACVNNRVRQGGTMSIAGCS